MQGVIESNNLSKFYGPTQALNQVNLSVKQGEVFGFLGPNGAGKTTFVKILLDFVRSAEGAVQILGSHPAHLDRGRVGYLPERVSIHPFLTAREFLRYQGRLAGVPGPALESRIEECLVKVKMQEAADRRIGDFSKGMIQRVGVAQAIIGQPELLLLDEPNSGLDPMGVIEIRETILAEKARGATVFLNSHQLLEVEKTCDRVAILNHGRVVAQGSQAELTGEQSVEVELEEANDSVLAVLKAEDETLRSNGRRFTVVPRNPESERTLPARLVEAGGRIVFYAQRSESLEEIFKRVVSGENQ